MTTITTKTAKNGAQLWYVDGKRVSHDAAIQAGFNNGRESLSNLLANRTAAQNEKVNADIWLEMNSEFGGRYDAMFRFSTVADAVDAARFLLATLGDKKIHRLKVTNHKAFPNNLVIAENARSRLWFNAGFEHLDTINATEVDAADYAITAEAQDVAINAEIENAAAAKIERELAKLEKKTATSSTAALELLNGLLPENHLHFNYAGTSNIAGVTYRHFTSIGTFGGATLKRMIEVVKADKLDAVLFIDVSRNNEGTEIKIVEQPAPVDTNAERIAELESQIAGIIAENSEITDALLEAEADEEISQDWIDHLNEQRENNLAEYWKLVDEIAAIKNSDEPDDESPEPETEPDSPDSEAATLVTELAAACEGVYVDDWTDTPVDSEPKIIPAADMRELLDGLPATDESLTAYRKNPDGTFSEDRDAYERLKAAEYAVLDATTDWNHMRELERATLGAHTPEPPEGDDEVRHLNANAPEGWTIERVDGNKFGINFNGERVTETDRVTARDLIIPRTFFEQFTPLVDKSKTPRQMFLDDRYRELADMEEMREGLMKLPGVTVKQMQTLDRLIEQLKRDIAQAEFDERDTVLNFCESGSAIDDDGNIWF